MHKDNRVLGPRPLSSDNWKINGCPVNGPRVAAQGPLVAAGWFTKAKGTGQVNIRFSQDAAATWGETFKVDADDPVGRVDLLALPNGQFVVSWLGRTKDGADLNLRRVANDGTMTPVSRLAALPPAEKQVFRAWLASATISSSSGLSRMRMPPSFKPCVSPWQAVGTKLLTTKLQNLPSHAPEGRKLSLTDLELLSPKGEPLKLKQQSYISSRFGRIGAAPAGKNYPCWSSFESAQTSNWYWRPPRLNFRKP